MVKPNGKNMRNRAKCLCCGDIIESKHVHDWVACSCLENGTGIFIDGGLDYHREGGCLENLKRLK